MNKDKLKEHMEIRLDRSWVNYFIAVLVLSLGINTSLSQVVVLKETVPEDFQELDNDFGPNRKRFSHPFVSYGTFGNVIDHNGQSQENVLLSRSIDLVSGERYYWNFSKIYSLVFDSNFSMRMFGINQTSASSFPLSTEGMKRPKYWLGSFGLAVGNQFNFKPKRGNQLGSYLYLGGYGNLNFVRRFTAHYDKNDVMPQPYKVTLKKFKEMNFLDYGATVKFGKTNFTIFAKYRLSDIFVQRNYQLVELPRLTFGIEFFSGNI
jgi:hypothetical protein